MNRSDILKLRNSISWKTVFRIVIINALIFYIIEVYIDILYGDKIAEYLSEIDRDLYNFFVNRKPIILAIFFLIIFSIVAFLEIRKSNKYIEDIITNVDKIIKTPEEEIIMPSNLVILENRLNNIRIDLVSNKNAAKEADAKKNDLIMYMAHDLKTPLTSVIGYLTLLTDEKNISPELQDKYLNIALNKSLRLEELTNEFFELTRYNFNNIPVNKVRLDLSILFDQLLEEFYPMLEERNLKININKPNTLMCVVDGDKLARAFGNLIKNAINYSYENTTICIDIEEKDNNIEINFRNRGQTIPKYKLDKIFDKFYRADESRGTKTGGAGLGLAITKDIITLHDGTIEVNSENEVIEFKVKIRK